MCRLWTSSSENFKLVRNSSLYSLPLCAHTHILIKLEFAQREELETLTAVAQEQQYLLKIAEDEAAFRDQDPLFFSIRPHPPADIPPLQGPPLDLSLEEDIAAATTTAAGSENTVNRPDLVLEIDAIEGGTVRGWACSRIADIPEPLTILVYVDKTLVSEVSADESIELPASAREVCSSSLGGGAAAGSSRAPSERVGFVANFPDLPQGRHTLRVFAQHPSTNEKIEARHSPALFLESSIQPDGVEALRRKDQIILRRNAELVALWDKVRTQIPFMEAEAAAAAAADEQGGGGGGKFTDIDLTQSNRLFAVILVHSDPEDYAFRTLARAAWVPATPGAAEELQHRLEIVVKFITVPPSPSLQETLLAESQQYNDIIIVAEEDAATSDARKVLGALAAATTDQILDADFYVVTRDQVVVDLDALSQILSSKRSQGNAYIGCMKSGGIVQDKSSKWYEPESNRFGKAENKGGGGELQYPVHAKREFYALSRHVARYLARSQTVLHPYMFEDTSMGAWLLGLEVASGEESRFCCDSEDACGGSAGRATGVRCAAYYEPSCSGVCSPKLNYVKVYETCVKDRQS